MARPRTYDDGSRGHVGVRFDRELIKLFDEVASKQGMTRNQAIEICIKQVVQNQRVPDSYFPDLESKLAQMKSTFENAQAKSGTRVKDRLLEGSDRKATSDGRRNKTTKISQSLSSGIE